MLVTRFEGDGLPLVSVSIVTWNHAASIRACIESILVQTHPRIEIIVHDNGSTDSTPEILRSIAAEQPGAFTLHLDSSNSGFCGGHNRNLRCVRGDYVLLANPDLQLNPDYISQALRVFSSRPGVGTVCGVLLQGVNGAGERIVDGAGMAVSRSRQLYLIGHGASESVLPEGDFEVFGADGAAPTYSRQLIEDCSVDGDLFDEAFFAHKEDHDVAWRARILGWKTMCARRAIAVHPRHFRPGDLSGRRRIDPVIRKGAVRNQVLLLIKNEDAVNLLIDGPWILLRQLTTIGYILLFERQSLAGYAEALRGATRAFALRRSVMAKRRASWREVRRAMTLGAGGVRDQQEVSTAPRA